MASEFRNILVVCVGNICRSPMAEAWLRQSLQNRGVDVSSAGLGALVGESADPFAQQAMLQKGLSLDAHKARQISQELVRNADLVLAMERGHVSRIQTLYPFATGRVFRLGHWRQMDIADPYQRPFEVFQNTCNLIGECCQDWHSKLGL